MFNTHIQYKNVLFFRVQFIYTELYNMKCYSVLCNGACDAAKVRMSPLAAVSLGKQSFAYCKFYLQYAVFFGSATAV